MEVEKEGETGLMETGNINSRGEGYLQNEKFCNNSQSSETNFLGNTSACLKLKQPVSVKKES